MLEQSEPPMTTVCRLSDFRRTKSLFCFSRQELDKLLSIYSRKVISGEWKAYAISHEGGMAQFSIFAHARARPLYTVVKLRRPPARLRRFSVMQGDRKVAQADTLEQVLNVFARSLKLVTT